MRFRNPGETLPQPPARFWGVARILTPLPYFRPHSVNNQTLFLTRAKQQYLFLNCIRPILIYVCNLPESFNLRKHLRTATDLTMLNAEKKLFLVQNTNCP